MLTPTFGQISDLLARRALGLMGAFESNVAIHHEDFYVGTIDLEGSYPIWLSSVESSHHDLNLNVLLTDLEDEYIAIIADSNYDSLMAIEYDECDGICGWYQNSTNSNRVWVKSNLEFIYEASYLIEGFANTCLWEKFVGDESVMKNHLKDFYNNDS